MNPTLAKADALAALRRARPEAELSVESKLAQPWATLRRLAWSSFQRQSTPQAAPSAGHPRPISRLGRITAGRPYRACLRDRPSCVSSMTVRARCSLAPRTRGCSPWRCTSPRTATRARARSRVSAPCRGCASCRAAKTWPLCSRAPKGRTIKVHSLCRGQRKAPDIEYLS